MPTYTLREPVLAIQYKYNGNEAAVMDLVRPTRNSPSSFTNIRGFLHVYNGGPDLEIRDGDWVVLFDRSVAVMSSEDFNGLFIQS